MTTSGSQSYLELLQLLSDHLHLCAHQALGIQPLFCPSQQASQLCHQLVELPDPLGSVFDLVQPGLAALTQLSKTRNSFTSSAYLHDMFGYFLKALMTQS